MKPLVILFCLLMGASAADAQRKPAPRPSKPTTAVKPGPVPKVMARIAGTDGGTINPTFARMLLDSALVLRDEKGNKYNIFKFTFAYKRKSVYKDEVTEQTIESFEMLTTEMRNNEQLDEWWRNTVKETIAPGEAIYFERILADSKKGYLIPVKGITFIIAK